jgi:hypothetical protein
MSGQENETSASREFGLGLNSKNPREKIIDEACRRPPESRWRIFRGVGDKH